MHGGIAPTYGTTEVQVEIVILQTFELGNQFYV